MIRRKLQATSLIAATLLLACVRMTAGQQPAADETRVGRLAGLARVWGEVKFFHPYLAYKKIDWDKALVDAIPPVGRASSPLEYSAALNQMLAVLGDKNTRAEIERESGHASAPSRIESASDYARITDGVLVLDAMTIAENCANDNSFFGRQVGPKIFPMLQQATAIVMDCRPKTEAKEEDGAAEFFFDLFLREALTAVCDHAVTLGASRYRMHNGYAPQTGGTSGGYYSALVSTAPQALAGQSKTVRPLVFIINDKTPALTPIFSGLQGTGRAMVVQEGESAEEPGVSSRRITLTDGVIVRMRTSENLNPDGSVGFAADVVVPKTDKDDAALNEAFKNIKQNTVSHRDNKTADSRAALRDLKDDAYPAMEYPGSEYRLLALFRFWNVINYFFPYKHLIGGSWGDVLTRYIPKFETDKDALEYQKTVRELVAEIHDSHGFVGGTAKYEESLGSFAPPFLVRYVGKQTVVTTVMDAKAGVALGDAILAVDGVAVEQRRAELARFFSASTPQALERRIHYQLLAGPKDSIAHLDVRGADGATHQIAVARSLSANEPKYYMASARTTPVMQVLPSGFGYADLARLKLGEVDKMFETLKDTPAIIFDMRGYPNGTAWAIAPRLTEKTHVTAAQFSRPILEATNLSDSDYSGGANFTFGQQIPERKGEVYKGKVVMLIDEGAISQAEHTCMFFEAATDVTFIGTPTAGANGDVTNMVLPGNITVNFSGHDVRHADGRQLQRVGIQPSITVAPTVADIRAGRDAVLETAINYLQQKARR